MILDTYLAQDLEKLHVISFDVPYPANYGGAIVVYNQLLAWKSAGVKIILHAFTYGDRQAQAHLDEICHAVHYYERATGIKSAMSNLPYIVNSRKSVSLLERLKKDSLPIFFEGVHTTAWIGHRDLRGRKKVLRMHNVEWQYYQSLESLGANALKGFYYKQEAKRLKAYDKSALGHGDMLFTISEKDQSYYNDRHSECHLLPAAHGQRIDMKSGRGDYYLFHGKLSVADNKKSAIDLLQSVFVNTTYQLVIAGLDPDEELKKLVEQYPNISLRANVSDAEMKTLIQNAHANVLYTHQDNGIKLKLLHALHIGRHCIVNTAMVSNASNLAGLCQVATSIDEIATLVKSIDNVPFTQNEIDKRAAILSQNYDNLANTKKALEIMKINGFN